MVAHFFLGECSGSVSRGHGYLHFFHRLHLLPFFLVRRKNTNAMQRSPLLLSLYCLLFTFACQPSPPSPHQEEWLSLFNGVDLTGWDIKITGRELNDNYLNTVQVQDSMIRIVYDEYEEFGTSYGHIYYQEPFSYYKLRFDYRFTGEQTKGGASWNVRNSGVMLHSQSAESVNFYQEFPVSIELQTLGGLGEGERTTANLCTPGTYAVYRGKEDHTHCIGSDSETYHGDQWVSVEAMVLGDSVVHHIIGKDTVLTFEKPMIDSVFINKNSSWDQFGVTDSTYWLSRAGQTLKEGYIALQAESHPIDFRNIRLLNLKGCMDPQAKNFKSYYLEPDSQTCLYETD
jgi:hypothetical protein